MRRNQRLGRILLFEDRRARANIQLSLSLLSERAKNTGLLFPQVKRGSDKAKTRRRQWLSAIDDALKLGSPDWFSCRLEKWLTDDSSPGHAYHKVVLKATG